MRRILCAVLLAIVSSTPSLAIKGEIDATDAFSFVVAIEARVGSQTSKCSGVAISPETVITAAHCMQSTNPSDYKISVIKNNKAQAVVAKEIVVHQEYKESGETTQLNESCWRCGPVQYSLHDIARIRVAPLTGIDNYPTLLTSYVERNFIAELTRTGKMNWGILAVILRNKFSENLTANPQALVIGFARGARRYMYAPLNSLGKCSDHSMRSDLGGDAWCLTSDATEKGDSGGPILLHDKNGKPTLIGILSGSGDGTWFTSLLPNLPLVMGTP